jgi:glycosyltransferase involved in cell wall biosynthesis
MQKIQVSIIIKALNEEVNISRCIESCIRETTDFKSEIILVDSLSTDKTISIANQYPIKIVQFESQSDVGCGAAPQLGYQHAQGEYIYIIDGDMELCEGFLDKALNYLNDNPSVAGVSGKLVDTQIGSVEDQRRTDLYNKIINVKNEKHLGGGGLYRKEAIDSVEYFSHSGLRSREEFELGARLLSKNWTLKRLPLNAVLHTGHNEGNIKRLCRQWKNGRLFASGGLLKSALGKPWFKLCVAHLWYLFVPLVVNSLIVLTLFVIGAYRNLDALFSIFLFLSTWLSVLILLSIKKKSVRIAINSLLTWNVGCLAFIWSFFKHIKEPEFTIKGKIIKSA